jgi:hypothetical protein
VKASAYKIHNESEVIYMTDNYVKYRDVPLEKNDDGTYSIGAVVFLNGHLQRVNNLRLASFSDAEELVDLIFTLTEAER